MKKFLLFIVCFAFVGASGCEVEYDTSDSASYADYNFLTPIVFAGELVETPQDIVINDPLTHHVELLDIRFFYSDTAPYAVLSFNIVSDTGDFITKHAITVSDSDFTDLVSGFGGTLKSRANSEIWSFIHSNYTTQAIP